MTLRSRISRKFLLASSQRLNFRRSVVLNVKSLNERGLISNVFPALDDKFVNRLASKSVAVYTGFDPTASALHVGNLLPLIGLLRFQRSGIRPIVVCLPMLQIGDATALVGDPSGKNKEREGIAADVVAGYSAGIRANIERIFANHAAHLWKSQTKVLPELKLMSNMDWYSKMNPVEFLGGVGRNIRMGAMLLKDSVQSRLNGPEGMSFAEFSYQAFQAYDWLHLFRKYDCFLQLGGHDQMGNMMAGYELIRRMTGDTAHCFTVPLVVNEIGSKFGKTAGNAVWLDESKTSTFEFYQFFLRLPDTEVEKYLRLFTLVPDEEIADIMAQQTAKPELRKAHKKLADQVTLLVHGDKGLELAQRATEAFFGSDIKALASLDPGVVSDIFGRAFVSNLNFTSGITVFDVVMRAKCFADERDARRVIAAGGVNINFSKMRNPDECLQVGEHVLPNEMTLIRIGKKNYYVVRWNS
ncbi:Tyrosine--tRNA ligase, mitochondrial [Hypsibius exemplaris]|uniref:Tyrosine--tRNA ligase n=1 Tax=Hypsibius exemplaris TaxID=2072580 RepID=A0A1W0XDM8_HYPEX|nr:Tyrosine--tRNA ligase, mitochondrial [Hypsibius exemplaris]